MVEVDINNGVFRQVDLSCPVFCAKCGKEIIRDRNKADFVVPVHSCGYAFCFTCKKALYEFAGPKLADYEAALVRQFVGVQRGRHNGRKEY